MSTASQVNSRNHPSTNHSHAQKGGSKTLFNKIKLVAQVIGFACIGLLAVYGGVVAATGGPPAWASGNLSSSITPVYISYQGTLRDADDNLANGTYNMVVKIYDNAGGTGAALWTETHNGVEVREGHFNLLLGESNPILRDIFTEPDRYIRLTVGGMVMNPTQRFASVPYAIAATYATTLSAPDGDPAEAVTVDNAGNVSVGDGSTSADVKIPKGGLCIDSDGTCGSPGDGGLRVGDSGIHGANSSNDNLYLVPVTGRVGIGTTDPQKKLDVNGGASVSGNLGVGTTNMDRPLTIKGTGSASEWISFKDTNDTTQWHLNYSHTGLNFVETGVAEGRLFLEDGGEVGIGTTNPQAKLDVNGTVNADALTIDGDKPIKFRRLSCTGHSAYCNYLSQDHVDTWACGTAGLWVNTDFDENAGDTDVLKAIAEPNDHDSDGRDEWIYKFDISRENTTQDWEFVVICVKWDIADIEGF